MTRPLPRPALPRPVRRVDDPALFLSWIAGLRPTEFSLEAWLDRLERET
ncbi:MAG: hypothetical protein AAFW69_06380 [Pseudomonadota bacterium]